MVHVLGELSPQKVHGWGELYFYQQKCGTLKIQVTQIASKNKNYELFEIYSVPCALNT